MDVYIEIAEKIKEEISHILLIAVNGQDKKYRTETGDIRWELVEKDIHASVNKNLLSDDNIS